MAGCTYSLLVRSNETNEVDSAYIYKVGRFYGILLAFSLDKMLVQFSRIMIYTFYQGDGIRSCHQSLICCDLYKVNEFRKKVFGNWRSGILSLK